MNEQKLINKYLFSEISKNSIIFIVLLVLIFSLFHFLDEIGKDYPMDSKVEYILYSIPPTINLLAGLGIFMASIVTVGNLNDRKELQIFLTGGISLFGFIRKTVLISLTLSLIMLIMGEIFSPIFSEKSLKIKAEATGKNFYSTNNDIWIKNDKFFINIKNNNGGVQFSGLSLFEINDSNHLTNFSYSDNGSLDSGSLKLQNAKTISFKKQDNSNFIKPITSKKKEATISVDFSQVEPLEKDERTMTLLELVESASFLASIGLKNEKFISEIFSRLTKPLMSVGLFLIAIPMLLNFSRTASLTKMILIGIALALIFNLLSKLMGLYAVNFNMNVYIASFLPILMIYLIAFISMIKIYRFK